VLKHKSKPTVSPTLATSTAQSASSLPRMLRNAERLLLVGMLMLLVGSLTACGHNQTRPSQPPVFPLKPALSTPLPSVPYSKVVQADMQQWEKQLKDTQTTPKR
jgi:hypothetical protein